MRTLIPICNYCSIGMSSKLSFLRFYMSFSLCLNETTVPITLFTAAVVLKAVCQKYFEKQKSSFDTVSFRSLMILPLTIPFNFTQEKGFRLIIIHENNVSICTVFVFFFFHQMYADLAVTETFEKDAVCVTADCE